MRMANGWRTIRLRILPTCPTRRRRRRDDLRRRSLRVQRVSTLISSPLPRRGEIWTANLGSPPIRHWVLIVSLDERNLSGRRDSVLIVPFSSSAPEGPTVIHLPPGETGTPGRSFVHRLVMQVFAKPGLI